MGQLRSNVLYNFGSQLCLGVLSLLVLPILLHNLGAALSAFLGSGVMVFLIFRHHLDRSRLRVYTREELAGLLISRGLEIVTLERADRVNSYRCRVL